MPELFRPSILESHRPIRLTVASSGFSPEAEGGLPQLGYNANGENEAPPVLRAHGDEIITVSFTVSSPNSSSSAWLQEIHYPTRTGFSGT